MNKNNKYFPLFIIYLLIGIVFYYPFGDTSISSFHADDGGLIAALSKADISNQYLNFIFNSANYKFRPIANLLYLINYELFGSRYNLYILFNIILISIFCLLVVKVSSRNTSNFTISILSGSAIMTSVFCLYPAWNMTGSFEILAAILFFSLLIVQLDFKEKKLLIYILSIFVVFTSERFLPAVIFLNFIMGDRIKDKIYNSAFIVTIFIGTRVALDIPFLVGTQTDNIKNSFDISRFMYFNVQSIFEIFGFSFGPKYLTGFEPPLNSSIIDIYNNKRIFKTLVFIFIGFVLNILIVKKLFFGSKSKNLIFTYLLLAMIFIAAASVTFRLEMRWLLPAFALYMGSIILYSNYNQKISGKFLIYLTLIFFNVHNFYYAKYYRSDVYFARELHSISIFNHYFR
jgi:hypothetical protein